MDMKCEEKVSNYIVKYHNDMNLVNFKNFTVRELNLFYAICSILRDSGETSVLIEYDYLRELAMIESTRMSEVKKIFKEMYNKMVNLKMVFRKDDYEGDFQVFVGNLRNRETGNVLIMVNPHLKYVLNNLADNFTMFELKEFNSLKSKYTKECYRNIKRFRRTGVWNISVDELKQRLGYPIDNPTKNFNRDVINPVLKELKPYINGLEIEKIKKGRNIISYKFTFEKEPEFNKDSYQIFNFDNYTLEDYLRFEKEDADYKKAHPEYNFNPTLTTRELINMRNANPLYDTMSLTHESIESLMGLGITEEEAIKLFLYKESLRRKRIQIEERRLKDAE